MRLPLLSLLALSCFLAPARAADKAPMKPAEVFGPTKLWAMHLTIPAKEWATMQPARGGFSRERKDAPALSDDRKRRGGFGYDFEYVKGDLSIGDTVLKDVGIRFKGNSTYMLTASFLKRPFKIDLDRHVEGQAWGGLKKLTFNNNVMDPTATREPLAFAVYRAAGVPAPRTAYLELTLTVPGKYDKAHVGLYTLIETVDRTFLKEHFVSNKGLLLKPEHAGALQYLGESWSSYASRYRPKTTATMQAQKRLIDFARLVNQGSDEQFNKEITSFVDIDRFVRYVAATVVLSSMDSFVGLGHNYYLYHEPKTDKFTVLPWDVDHSFGALTMLGSANDLMNLSLRKPYWGTNRLVERILKDEKHYAEYRGHVAMLLERTFTVEAIKANVAAIDKTLAEARARDRKARNSRLEGWSTWKLLEWVNPPPTMDAFVTKRIASLEAQLAGKSEGVVLRGRGPSGGAERLLVRPALLAADRDKDGALSRDEAVAGVRELFKACDREGKGSLDQKALTAGLEKLVPRPPAPAGLGIASPSAAIALSRGIMARAAKDGKVTADAMALSAEKLFEKADRNRSGKLDSREMTEALRELLAPPPLPDKTKADRTKAGG